MIREKINSSKRKKVMLKVQSRVEAEIQESEITYQDYVEKDFKDKEKALESEKKKFETKIGEAEKDHKRGVITLDAYMKIRRGLYTRLEKKKEELRLFRHENKVDNNLLHYAKNVDEANIYNQGVEKLNQALDKLNQLYIDNSEPIQDIECTVGEASKYFQIKEVKPRLFYDTESLITRLNKLVEARRISKKDVEELKKRFYERIIEIQEKEEADKNIEKRIKQ